MKTGKKSEPLECDETKESCGRCDDTIRSRIKIELRTEYSVVEHG